MRLYICSQWHKIDVVISDNRVGLYNSKVVSVYITHQLAVKTGNWFTSKIAEGIHKYFINKFDECWVPDFRSQTLAGELSHSAIMPKNVKYIGALSRFEKKSNVEKKYDLLIILSGPEPQRTILENLLLNDLLSYANKTLLIRGLPGNAENIFLNNDSVKIINHLAADELCLAIQQSDIIISRSGYTTVMDLVKLTKQAILIATPGQPEQEYLARFLKEKKFIFSVEQENFNLEDTLKKFSEFQCYIPAYDMEQYRLVISEFVSRISAATRT
jgi:predicted glycosyltransferase